MIDGIKTKGRNPLYCKGNFSKKTIGWAFWVCLSVFFQKKFIAIWLILPVVIRLSQRFTHACLSLKAFLTWNCERLIKPVIVHLIVFSYKDTSGKSRNNTCIKRRLFGSLAFVWFKPIPVGVFEVIQNNLANRRALVAAMNHSSFCPIRFHSEGIVFGSQSRVTENQGSIPEREP